MVGKGAPAYTTACLSSSRFRGLGSKSLRAPTLDPVGCGWRTLGMPAMVWMNVYADCAASLLREHALAGMRLGRCALRHTFCPLPQANGCASGTPRSCVGLPGDKI